MRVTLLASADWLWGVSLNRTVIGRNVPAIGEWKFRHDIELLLAKNITLLLDFFAVSFSEFYENFFG